MPSHDSRRHADGGDTDDDGADGRDDDVGYGVNVRVHAVIDADGTCGDAVEEGVGCPMLCVAQENSPSLAPRQAIWYNMWNLTASRP